MGLFFIDTRNVSENKVLFHINLNRILHIIVKVRERERDSGEEEERREENEVIH